MIQRNEQSRAESSDTVRAKTSQEKLWFETPPESRHCQWHRRQERPSLLSNLLTTGQEEFTEKTN